jgi:DNA mismatch repair protein MutS
MCFERKVKDMAFTPMMQQYLNVKERCKDCILFFRLGDFYEMFFEDAEIASRELELVLTGRDCGLDERAPMCGIPYHAANIYIGRLINRGYKVAICEQLEDPALAQGIVKRDIIKVITPGTYTDSCFLDEDKNNYIMSIYIEDNHVGISFSDVSTSEFYSTECTIDISSILNEISKYSPKEILVQEDVPDNLVKAVNEKFQILFSKREDCLFRTDADINLQSQFHDFDSKMYSSCVLFSSNGLINYIHETQKNDISYINKFEYYNIQDYLCIDINTRRNLEITETIREKSKKGSLLWVIDRTSTSMGLRQLRRWLEEPLVDKAKITLRLDAVGELTKRVGDLENLRLFMKDVYDIERISGKISSQSVNAKELIALKTSLEKIPSIKSALKEMESNLLCDMYEKLDELKDIYSLLSVSISDNPSVSVKEGNIIKDGFNSEIDELRKAKLYGREWIASLENSEREATGIKSLKVGYNKVFGYYIEITKANYNLIPEGRYIRKQTLANAERYITPELKEMEDKILGAEEKLINLEYNLFCEIRDKVAAEIDRLKTTARVISETDCLCSLAATALENNYCKPEINSEDTIEIKDGRHPVVEKMIPPGTFVANDIKLNTTDSEMLLITGPNMAGKSTYMRQIALIVILAQIGSFVPASYASISVCDKIFTRIGASDDLAGGKSTFMVEMWEVSNILKNATRNSLVILDEVGRGTSTYDGLSIAWSVIEYICTNKNLKCKTLFATHYHELTSLEGKIKGLKNYSVSVKEINSDIVFLRRIVKGGADQSYGIEVAKLAGLPAIVVERAKEILKELEEKNASKEHTELKETAITIEKQSKQMDIFELRTNNIISEISSIDIMNMTPMEGFNKLYEIIMKVKGDTM